MTRNPVSGGWHITESELRVFLIVLPLVQVIFAGGAAFAATRAAIAEKVDRREFIVHVQEVAMAFQRIHISDSLQVAALTEDRVRLREIVCAAVKGCR